ncbi:uncharacterized protein LOC110837903 isoform X2 [Zootermopsis nevadensis]|uniref:uncharacterized protein LOC110837903 isoform X2 n=1 Tax=Zootermopsis nevadensis TaxID=136037 RepID=UPI000B8E4377|nr:uncharacterized protein LOC110837903 isoform X2 [Zootermopsis nevadensis]
MLHYKASHDHTEQMSQLLQLSVKDYITETKVALSTQGGASHFTYVVEDGQFMWKKLDQLSNIKIKYGCIQLAETPYHEAAEQMLDSLLEQCCSVKTEVTSLQETNIIATQERTVLMKKLVEYKKQKLEMEMRLFGQFLGVLNSKKEYIQQLENGLPAATNKNSHKPVQHEGSAKEVEDSSPQGNVDDLFDDMRKPVSVIPKRISRPKRHGSEAAAGPSSRKVTRAAADGEQSDTRCLLDDF